MCCGFEEGAAGAMYPAEGDGVVWSITEILTDVTDDANGAVQIHRYLRQPNGKDVIALALT